MAMRNRKGQSMHIDLFSDLICPWCYIGKRRLDSVLQGPVGDGITVRWRAFQLQPGLPPEGVDRAQFLARRYGPEADTARGPARILEQGAELGLAFDYAAIRRMPNTLLGHRLMALAEPFGRQHELAESLFRRYFCDGEDLGDARVLGAAANEVGLPAAELLEDLRAGAGAAAVQDDLAAAATLEITGVPAFLLAGRFVLPGAQSTETMGQFIERAKSRFG
jgi:predicted DsbA family dithiol-disulfide isomerase